MTPCFGQSRVACSPCRAPETHQRLWYRRHQAVLNGCRVHIAVARREGREASSWIAAPLIRGAAIHDPCRRAAGRLSRHASPAGTGGGRADHRVPKLRGGGTSADAGATARPTQPGRHRARATQGPGDTGPGRHRARATQGPGDTGPGRLSRRSPRGGWGRRPSWTRSRRRARRGFRPARGRGPRGPR